MKPRLLARILGLAMIAFTHAPRAWAQESSPGTGTVRGQVIDSESAAPIDGVTVTVTPSAGATPGGPGGQERVTDASGAYEFPALPAGSYSIKFTKSGYRVSLMTSFTVKAGEMNRADFPLPPLPPQAAEEMPGFEEFVVEASPMEEILAASRMESDELLNTLNAAEFAKFAASDVADALKFVPGVNVVNGQFAIIRGLEDRYSSTLYNSAVVPSPDPDSQSVQLDLFPSDVVTNLVVAKTFAPDLPSNSSGGAINIHTNGMTNFAVEEYMLNGAKLGTTYWLCRAFNESLLGITSPGDLLYTGFVLVTDKNGNGNCNLKVLVAQIAPLLAGPTTLNVKFVFVVGGNPVEYDDTGLYKIVGGTPAYATDVTEIQLDSKR